MCGLPDSTSETSGYEHTHTHTHISKQTQSYWYTHSHLHKFTHSCTHTHKHIRSRDASRVPTRLQRAKEPRYGPVAAATTLPTPVITPVERWRLLPTHHIQQQVRRTVPGHRQEISFAPAFTIQGRHVARAKPRREAARRAQATIEHLSGPGLASQPRGWCQCNTIGVASDQWGATWVGNARARAVGENQIGGSGGGGHLAGCAAAAPRALQGAPAAPHHPRAAASATTVRCCCCCCCCC